MTAFNDIPPALVSDSKDRHSPQHSETSGPWEFARQAELVKCFSLAAFPIVFTEGVLGLLLP
jgi:hypothetical protein